MLGGSSEQEAVLELHDAIEVWIVACNKAGEAVPEPSKSSYATAA